MPFLLLDVQESVSFNFRDISDRKVWKSIREASCSPSPPIHSWSSCSVGFCPRELNKVPNSWGAKVGDPTWNKHRDFKILNPTGLQGEPVVLVLVKELEGVIELLDLLRLHWMIKMCGLHGTSRAKLRKHAACPILILVRSVSKDVCKSKMSANHIFGVSKKLEALKSMDRFLLYWCIGIDKLQAPIFWDIHHIEIYTDVVYKSHPWIFYKPPSFGTLSRIKPRLLLHQPIGHDSNPWE